MLGKIPFFREESKLSVKVRNGDPSIGRVKNLAGSYVKIRNVLPIWFLFPYLNSKQKTL